MAHVNKRFFLCCSDSSGFHLVLHPLNPFSISLPFTNEDEASTSVDSLNFRRRSVLVFFLAESLNRTKLWSSLEELLRFLPLP